MPVLLTPAVVALMWFYMYDPNIGIIQFLGSSLGLPVRPWLSDVDTAMPAVMVANVWEWTPFAFLVFVAGMKSVSPEIVEAAMIDGAGPWAIGRHILLPLLWPVIAVVALLLTIDNLKGFRPDLRDDERRPGRVHLYAADHDLEPGLRQLPDGNGMRCRARAARDHQSVRPGFECRPAADGRTGELPDDAGTPGTLRGQIVAAEQGGGSDDVSLRRRCRPRCWCGFSRCYGFFSTSLKDRPDIFSRMPLLFFAPTLDNYLDVLSRQEFTDGLINSIKTASLTTVLAIVIGIFRRLSAVQTTIPVARPDPVLGSFSSHAADRCNRGSVLPDPLQARSSRHLAGARLRISVLLAALRDLDAGRIFPRPAAGTR